MKIAVCVSLVPDSTTKIKVGQDNKSIDETGVSFIINPYDEFAVEESVQIKEKFGGDVTAISYGTEKSKEAIKKAFQMGADKGILIKTEQKDFDTFTVARNLSDLLKELSPDIIFFGKQSIDYDGTGVPNLVGALLNLPSINVVTKLEIDNNNIKAEREIEGGKEIVISKMPIIIGTQKGINNPRYPNLKSIMASKSKPIEEKKPTYEGNVTTILKMKLPESKSKGKILSEGVQSIPELVKLLRDEAKVI